MEEEKSYHSPKIDRFLMRLKDAIIIIPALIALIKIFYLNPIQTQQQVERQEKLLNRIANNLDTHTKQLADLNNRFLKVERSMYADMRIRNRRAYEEEIIDVDENE